MIDSADLLADALEDALSDRALDVPIVEEALAAMRSGAQLVMPGDLLGTKEAAELLGVDRTTASRWKKAGYMPTPFAETATGPLWLRATLETFAAKHRANADAAGRRPVGTAQR